MSLPVIELNEVGHSVGGRRTGTMTILDGVSLMVRRGESVAIMGPSGSGKSTLLALCMGLIRPTRRAVLVGGVDVSTLGRRALASLRSRDLGIVFQSGELLAELTPVENVALPCVLRKESAASAKVKAGDLLHALGVGNVRGPTARLSGGERQRVALARALINSPSVILADEPTGALDEQTRDDVADLLFRMPNLTGCGLVVVTHDSEVAAHADRRMRLTMETPQPDSAGDR